MFAHIPLRLPGRNRIATAKAELVIIIFLVSAVAAFVWNGSELLQLVARGRANGLDPSVQVAAAALVLNVALILFGWRRYVDLQHEAELRAAGERRAAEQAATDSITGLANRKGFADGVERLCRDELSPDHTLVIVSLQMQRFKQVNDRHGYDMGDALLREIAGALRADVPADAIIAPVSGDEIAIAGCVRTAELAGAERLPTRFLPMSSRTTNSLDLCSGGPSPNPRGPPEALARSNGAPPNSPDMGKRPSPPPLVKGKKRANKPQPEGIRWAKQPFFLLTRGPLATPG